VAALLALSSSYCYSETVGYGQTNNAAINGLTWAMPDVLPNLGTSGYTLTINGVIYRYTVDKETGDELLVHVRNKHITEEESYIFQETDDWSGLPGNTINKLVPLPNLKAELFGDGEIATEGEGTVSDPTVLYNYRYNYDMCWNPLNDPTCPGFLMALYKYLKDNGLLGTELGMDDPYYDEWVQAQLQLEAELEEEKDAQQEEEKDSDLEEELSIDSQLTMDALIDVEKQDKMLIALQAVPTITPYYSITIDGGMYEETITLKDANLPDNRRALSNLASDAKHRSMVRSQYNDVQTGD